jgi:hypothetical protein
MTDWKRSMTIGLGPSSPRRATTGEEPDRDTTGVLPSSDDASRAAAGRADCGVHSLRGRRRVRSGVASARPEKREGEP